MTTDKKEYGRLHMRIVELLAERNISKTRMAIISVVILTQTTTA